MLILIKNRFGHTSLGFWLTLTTSLVMYFILPLACYYLPFTQTSLYIVTTSLLLIGLTHLFSCYFLSTESKQADIWTKIVFLSSIFCFLIFPSGSLIELSIIHHSLKAFNSLLYALGSVLVTYDFVNITAALLVKEEATSIYQSFYNLNSTISTILLMWLFIFMNLSILFVHFFPPPAATIIFFLRIALITPVWLYYTNHASKSTPPNSTHAFLRTQEKLQKTVNATPNKLNCFNATKSLCKIEPKQLVFSNKSYQPTSIKTIKKNAPPSYGTCYLYYKPPGFARQFFVLKAKDIYPTIHDRIITDPFLIKFTFITEKKQNLEKNMLKKALNQISPPTKAKNQLEIVIEAIHCQFTPSLITVICEHFSLHQEYAHNINITIPLYALNSPPKKTQQDIKKVNKLNGLIQYKASQFTSKLQLALNLPKTKTLSTQIMTSLNKHQNQLKKDKKKTLLISHYLKAKTETAMQASLKTFQKRLKKNALLSLQIKKKTAISNAFLLYGSFTPEEILNIIINFLEPTISIQVIQYPNPMQAISLAPTQELQSQLSTLTENEINDHDNRIVSLIAQN